MPDPDADFAALSRWLKANRKVLRVPLKGPIRIVDKDPLEKIIREATTR